MSKTETSLEFCCKMAFSGSAYKDLQGHVHDIFDGSFPCKGSVKCSLGDIFIPSCNMARGKRGLFSFVEGMRENYPKRVEKSSSSRNQCRYADGKEFQ